MTAREEDYEAAAQSGRMPPIPTRDCFVCSVKTNETHSVYGIGHYKCYMFYSKTIAKIAIDLAVIDGAGL